MRLQTIVAMRLVITVVRLNTVAVRLEIVMGCVFVFKRSCSGKVRIENDY